MLHVLNHRRLPASFARRASDMILGSLLLVVGVAAIAAAEGKPFDRWDRLDPWFFPVVVGGLVLALGGVLLARGGAGLSAPWSLRALAITALTTMASLIVLAVGVQSRSSLLLHLLLLFGPADYAAAIILILTIAVMLARMSRLRACGMALLGLLLATVGSDIETGGPRLSLGLEALNDAFELSFLDLVVTADAAMCLLDPSSYAASYTQILAGWTNQQIPVAAQAGMRIAAALIIAGRLYLFSFDASAGSLCVLMLVALFGIACRAFAWNRLILLLAFAVSGLLEESVRRTMLISRGNPVMFVSNPLRATMLSLAGAIACVVLIRFARRRRARQPAADGA